MNIFFSQIYIEPGVDYLFSHIFQKWLSKELTSMVVPSEKFNRIYGNKFDLIFRISAKINISAPEIEGPTIFKRDKDVEYTIFLPHDGKRISDPIEHEKPLKLLLEAVVKVLTELEIDSNSIKKTIPELIIHIISTPTMFSK